MATAQLPTARYARAESLLVWNARHLVTRATIDAHWLDEGDRFWYRVETADGPRVLMVDPDAGTAPRPFDPPSTPATEPGVLRSPDGRLAAFVRDHNLYVGHVDGRVQALTTDGAPLDGYGELSEGRLYPIMEARFGIVHPPAALWSPDSKRLVTHRLDQHNVRPMALVQSVPPEGMRPVLHTYRYALPGDSVLPLARMVVFDIETGDEVWLDTDPIIATYRSPFEWNYVWWDEAGTRIYFVDYNRGETEFRLRVADAGTGATRTVLVERGDSFVELNPWSGNQPNVRFLDDGAEIIWWSERDGWGHLYLYDGITGAVKRQLTGGAWQVRDIIHVDEPGRMLYFTAGGREAGRDPYLRHLYRVGLDGGEPELLTPEHADHDIAPSPTGRYFIDTYSRIDTTPVTVLRDANGHVVRTLEAADLSRLLERGYRFPEPVVVKGRDGETDIYGALFFPSDFDSTKSYPVIDDLYPGPQIIVTPKGFGGGFGSPWRFWDAQALAELGFIVVTLDGMGTPLRSKAFHDVSYRNMQDAGGLPDHVTGLRELARERPYMDLERMGVYGRSGGGFATGHAMLDYPDFYKVGVSAAGNHDNRVYLARWGEKHQGLLEDSDWDPQANPTNAANLQGKLLIIWAEMDENVHPAGTIRLIDALIKANKDFDQLLLPNWYHSFVGDPYVIRRHWDYFVTHLLGLTPPSGYEIRRPTREEEIYSGIGRHP